MLDFTWGTSRVVNQHLQLGSLVCKQYPNMASHIPSVISENKDKDSGLLAAHLSQQMEVALVLCWLSLH